MVLRISLILAALVVVLGVPFAMRPRSVASVAPEQTDHLVIISPHNEAIRHEFTAAFRHYYREKTGRDVHLDWRVPGGGSEIAHYLASEYTAAFRNDWVQHLGKSWDATVSGAFDNPAIVLGADPARDTPAEAARRAFLNSDVGIGIDLFFGGGTYDFVQQAKAGRLVNAGILETHPAWFREDVIPQKVSGEPFYDAEGRWIGTAISSFGICSNTDLLQRLGITSAPTVWSDLANPALVGQIALADPTQSGSAAKAFEQIIQQKIQEHLARFPGNEAEAVRAGWREGLSLIQKISANARVFTDAASKVPLDVSQGDAAAGMCIDFYGRFQSEAVRRSDGTSRLQYITPPSGSSLGVDPIAMLRGAPHAEIARTFMAYVLSSEGQKLWNFKVDSPGGPERFALRRLPVRKDFYVAANEPYRSDPGINPYVEAESFHYHEAWTSPLFRVLGLAIRAMAMDTHQEQVKAWRALIAADFPTQAMARFSDLSMFDYDKCREEILPILKSPDRLGEVRLIRDLSGRLRRQYEEAAELARKGL